MLWDNNYFRFLRNISLISGCLFHFYRAPQGCLQYFFENVNTITSYNFDGNIGRAGTEGGVLANQDYRICIKQNPGIFLSKLNQVNCRINPN